MKKPSFLRLLSRLCVGAGAFLLLSLLSSCASLPAGSKVPLLAVLEQDAGLYLHVPVQAHQAFAKSLMDSWLTGLREKDLNRIVARTQHVYVALGGKNSAFQLAASGSYPAAALKSALSPKNGWERRPLSATEAGYSYYIQKNALPDFFPLELSFPESGFACISDNVAPMVRQYEAAYFSDGCGLEAAPAGWNQKLYAFLAEDCAEIRFASSRPDILLSAFLGEQTGAGIKAVYGSIAASPAGTAAGSSFPARASLSFTLEVAEPRTIKAVAAAVKLALFPVASQVRVTDQTHIQVSDYTISWKQLSALFAL